MSTSKFKIIAEETTQPSTFRFNSENLVKAKKIIKMYPSNFKESSISFFTLGLFLTSSLNLGSLSIDSCKVKGRDGSKGTILQSLST